MIWADKTIAGEIDDGALVWADARKGQVRGCSGVDDGERSAMRRCEQRDPADCTEGQAREFAALALRAGAYAHPCGLPRR